MKKKFILLIVFLCFEVCLFSREIERKIDKGEEVITYVYDNSEEALEYMLELCNCYAYCSFISCEPTFEVDYIVSAGSIYGYTFFIYPKDESNGELTLPVLPLCISFLDNKPILPFVFLPFQNEIAESLFRKLLNLPVY